MSKYYPFIAIAILLLMLNGCSTPGSAVDNTKINLSPSTFITPAVLPEYLYEVWPAPNTHVPYGEYANSLQSTTQGGVVVTIGLFDIGRILSEGRYGEDLEREVENLDEQVDLFLDGKLVSRENLMVSDTAVLLEVKDQNGVLLYKGSSAFTFSWNTPLAVGEHAAKLVVTGASGKKQEYVWNFQLT